MDIKSDVYARRFFISAGTKEYRNFRPVLSSWLCNWKSKGRKEVNVMLFAPKEKGQGLVEYALILVLVAIVVIAVLMLLGPIIGNVFSTLNNSLSSASS